MSDKLRKQFYDKVYNKYKSYLEVKRTAKHGLNVVQAATFELAIALYHFRELIPSDRRPTYAEIDSACPSYRLVDNLAQLAKHSFLDKKDNLKRARIITSLDQVSETMVITEYFDEQGRYIDARIEVTSNNGLLDRGEIERSINSVLNYWINFVDPAREFYSDESPPYIAGSRFLARDEVETQTNIEVVRGLEVECRWQFLTFDNDLQKAVPLDLTDYKAYANLDPSKSLGMTIPLKIGDDDSPTEVDVMLSLEEITRLQTVRNRKELEAFVESVFDAHRAEIEAKIASMRPEAIPSTSTE